MKKEREAPDASESLEAGAINEAKKDEAATKIQAAFRGKRNRNKVRAMKKEREAPDASESLEAGVNDDVPSGVASAPRRTAAPAPPATQEMRAGSSDAHDANVVSARDVEGCWLQVPVSPGPTVALPCVSLCCSTTVIASLDDDHLVARRADCFPLLCGPLFVPALCARALVGPDCRFALVRTLGGVRVDPLEFKMIETDPYRPVCEFDHRCGCRFGPPAFDAVSSGRHRHRVRDFSQLSITDGILPFASGWEALGAMFERPPGSSSGTSVWRFRRKEGEKGLAMSASPTFIRGTHEWSFRLFSGKCFSAGSGDRTVAAYSYGVAGDAARAVAALEPNDAREWRAAQAGALKVGSVSVLRACLDNGVGLAPHHTNTLAANGHAEALTFALQHGVPFDQHACAAAAYHVDVEKLRYCMQNGAPWYDEVIDAAVLGKSVACIRFCQENGLLFTPASLYLALTPREFWRPSPPAFPPRDTGKDELEVLKLCLQAGAPPDLGALEKAIVLLRVSTVRLFAESGHPFGPAPNRRHWDVEIPTSATEWMASARVAAAREIRDLCASRGTPARFYHNEVVRSGEHTSTRKVYLDERETWATRMFT